MKILNILLIITGGLFVFTEPVKKSTKKPHVANCCVKGKVVCAMG